MSQRIRPTGGLDRRRLCLALAVFACALWPALPWEPGAGVLAGPLVTPPPGSTAAIPPAAVSTQPAPLSTPTAYPPVGPTLPDASPWLMLGGTLLVFILTAALVAGLGIWLYRRGQASSRPAPSRQAAPPPAAAPVTPAAATTAPPATPAAAAPAEPGPAPYLEFEGTQAGPRRFFVGGQPLTVGRAPESDICITETFPGWDSVSRHHARIVREVRHGQPRFIVEDLSSRNGVFVNGRRTGRNVLRDGWRVSLGRVTFTYRTNETGSPRERSATR